MITEAEKKTIKDIARKYNVSRILLFGSATKDLLDYRDIDLAVEGIRDEDFYSFYGELIFALEKPVDLIDLSIKSKFIDLILEEGIPLDA